MPSKINQCSCTGTPATKFQDETYGKGFRVHTEGEKELTCTCCGKKIKKDK